MSNIERESPRRSEDRRNSHRRGEHRRKKIVPVDSERRNQFDKRQRYQRIDNRRTEEERRSK